MYVQLAFIVDRVKGLARQHPDWKATQPFKGVLEGDMKAVAATGEKGLIQLMAATHAGMIPEQFQKIVSDWLAETRQTKLKRPYTECVYQPIASGHQSIHRAAADSRHRQLRRRPANAGMDSCRRWSTLDAPRPSH